MKFEIKSEVLNRFVDDDGVVISFPSKFEKKLFVVYYVASKFKQGKRYTEIEVNNVIREWIAYKDYVEIRRFLIDYKFLERDREGKEYKVNDYEIIRN